jgi:hypothetical protein
MSLPRNQRFYIPANSDKIVKIMDDLSLDISCATWSSALNACSRGAIRIGLDPTTCELVLAVRDKISPALERLAIECGDCEIAAALMYLSGAAICGDLIQAVQKFT